MNTSFKEYVQQRLNENTGEGFLQIIFHGIQKAARLGDPFCAALMADRPKLAEFISLTPQVLQSMSPQERTQLTKGPKELGRLLNAMSQQLIRKYPELGQGQPQQQQGQGQPQQQLLSLAYQLAKQLGQPPQVYVNALRSVMAKNPDRVAIWASQIKTPKDLLAKFNDWKQRGII